MHCIRTQVLPQSYKTTQLQQAIFRPITTERNTLVSTKTAHAFNLKTSKKALYHRGKRLLQALSVVALILPTKSLTHNTELTAFNKVLSSKTFDVATIASDSTLFQYNEHQHGFGYDVARNYAEHLDATLTLHQFQNSEEALLALNNGEVDAVLTDDALNDSNLAHVNVSCGMPLTNQGLSDNTRLSFKQDDKFSAHATSYLCNEDTMNHTWHLAKFYNQNTLDDYSQWRFNKVMTERLPSLKNTFVTQANKYNHDWKLLAAVSYQESQLNPNAVSPTGVRGIMMLTNDTAEAMGVSDRTNPIQSIQGGAKYLEMLNQEFSDIAQEDRLWFVLASYNMGPNAVKRIQRELTEDGKNPHSWGEFYRYLSANESKNSRYTQCIQYVTNIRTYLETIQDISIA